MNGPSYFDLSTKRGICQTDIHKTVILLYTIVFFFSPYSMKSCVKQENLYFPQNSLLSYLLQYACLKLIERFAISFC